MKALGAIFFKIFIITACAVLPLACGGPKEHSLAGETMGTTYHIKVVAGQSVDWKAVHQMIEARLAQINQSMSTFRPDSEISRFNAMTRTDEPFPISADFLRVMLSAREIHRLSQGAWDGTVDPLVDLWGFGKSGPLKNSIPPAQAIERARRQVGFNLIDISVNGYLTKKSPHVTVDLASIAKGYGVDQIAVLLNGFGFKNYLVEIGGEVYAAGRRPDGQNWRVGISRPQAGAAPEDVYKVVRLHKAALATSGDYRNFYRIDGRTYAHIIDPRTGYPLQNGVVSASVVADNCTLADGLATALMVMGPKQGVALLDRLSGVEGMIVVRQPDGALENFQSQGISAHFED
ncbi:MAG: FAD:protein FMN transferase [Desulfobacteraceae bacterium]|nr:MAG: FAD:protein FMN transferase [Desulfobacteraceae bacterium]